VAASATASGEDGSTSRYQDIETSWDRAVAGFTSAVALFKNAGVPSGDWLPYRYLLFRRRSPPATGTSSTTVGSGGR